MSAEEGVRSASDQFYSALNQMLNGDASKMTEVWSHGDGVTTMHPIGGRELGWAQVERPWIELAKLASNGRAEMVDKVVEVSGDMGYEVGTERGSVTLAGQVLAIDHRCTNVYRREAGTWKIVHHHSDVAPAMVDALHRLQAN